MQFPQPNCFRISKQKKAFPATYFWRNVRRRKSIRRYIMEMALMTARRTSAGLPPRKTKTTIATKSPAGSCYTSLATLGILDSLKVELVELCNCISHWLLLITPSLSSLSISTFIWPLRTPRFKRESFVPSFLILFYSFCFATRSPRRDGSPG